MMMMMMMMTSDLTVLQGGPQKIGIIFVRLNFTKY